MKTSLINTRALLPCLQKVISTCQKALIPVILHGSVILGTSAGSETGGATNWPTLPGRQVHLDFHTSQWIPEVGTRFNKAQWQEALKLGRVNSINIFAKCHHSCSCYPTSVGRQHPNLRFDLLGAQAEACHEIGVRRPFYFAVGWSATDAEDHPEWCVRKKDGSVATINWDEKATPTDRRPIVSWKFLCPSGDYRELIPRQREKLCRRHRVDGFWYDITYDPACYCEHCRAGMKAEGVDVQNDEAVSEYNTRKWRSFFSALRQLVATQHPQATVFFNHTAGLTADNLERRMFAYNTQQEMEDLPTTWGEFAGFKHPDAIRYEAAAMIANGVACNFGDQLHPSGEMDMETYRYVAHSLYAPPLQRGRCLVIEDLPELQNVPVAVRVEEKITKAYLIPGDKWLSLRNSESGVSVVVPAFQSHVAVVLEY